MSEVSTEGMQQLFLRLCTEGVDTSELIDWRSRSLGAILLATESGTCYVVEPIAKQPSLVTRFSEATPYYGEFRLPSTEMILRRPGNPSIEIRVGETVTIYGLPRTGTDFDPDSLYTTTPLVEIRYLETIS